MIDLGLRHGFGGVDLELRDIPTVAAAREAAGRLADGKLQWGLFWMPADTVAAEVGSLLGRLLALC